MVQMTVVEVVDVVAVAHGRMATSWTVDVGVIGVFGVSARGHGLPSCPLGWNRIGI
jgi:hypothetical protein